MHAKICDERRSAAAVKSLSLKVGRSYQACYAKHVLILTHFSTHGGRNDQVPKQPGHTFGSWELVSASVNTANSRRLEILMRPALGFPLVAALQETTSWDVEKICVGFIL